MEDYPIIIKNIINCFKKFPGIGEKTAERLALATLDMNDEFLNLLSTSLRDIKHKIIKCNVCNNLSEEELCQICKSEKRDKKTICVVEDSKTVVRFEKIGTYNGLYHVLEGLISPLDGINPDDINIKSLINRISKDEINEVIIAVKPSIEGETTSSYISKLLEKSPVKVSKIAHGIPIGIDMEYIDNLTLEMALEDRKKIS